MLERAIATVLDQTESNLEVLIIDDGSTDNTPDILKEAQKNDSRVRSIRNDKSRGAASARNQGIQESQAELIAFNDDDCSWTPGKIAAQIEALRNPRIGLAYSSMLLTDLKGHTILVGEPPTSLTAPRKALLQRNFIGTPMAMVRRHLLLEVGGFDVSLPCLQDWDLWLRLSPLTEFAFVRDEQVTSEYLPGGITSRCGSVDAAVQKLLQNAYETGLSSPQEQALIKSSLARILIAAGAWRAAGHLLWESFHTHPSTTFSTSLEVAKRRMRKSA